MDELGGAVAAIEAGFVQGEIEEAAYRFQTAVETGDRVVVGVNEFTEETVERIELHRVDPAGEQRQRDRSREVRSERNPEAATTVLALVRETASGSGNLLPPLREALRARCTVGELCGSAAGALGHVRRPMSAISSATASAWPPGRPAESANRVA